MQHKKGYRKLGRDTAHRISMLNNMVISMIQHGAIITTTTKAKTLRPYLERLITKVKNNADSLTVLREIHSKFGNNKEAIKKMYDFIKNSLSLRNGGYTRIIKICYRKSDSSSMSKLEFVDN